MLQSNLHDYSDAYILVRGNITVQAENNRAIDGYNRNLILKNNPPFINCISKINNVLADKVEYLDTVIPMYNFIEFDKFYSKTSSTLWNYCKDISTDSIANSESLEYKASITGKIADDENTNKVDFSVPLKHLSSFWRTLDMPLINCEVSLTLAWSKSCVITDETTNDANPGANITVLENRVPTGGTFEVTDTKLYVPVVTLSTQDDDKLWEQLKTGFKRTIKWNKYRLKITNQAKTNNLIYLIDPTFSKVNRLFVSSFRVNENQDKDDRTSFSKYHTPTVEKTCKNEQK